MPDSVDIAGRGPFHVWYKPRTWNNDKSWRHKTRRKPVNSKRVAAMMVADLDDTNLVAVLTEKLSKQFASALANGDRMGQQVVLEHAPYHNISNLPRVLGSAETAAPKTKLRSRPRIKTKAPARKERKAPKKVKVPPNSKPDKPDKQKTKPVSRKGQGYVSVKPEPGQARAIQRWMTRTCGLEGGMTARDMHVTLLYDKRNWRFEVDRRRGAQYAAKPKTIALFGETLVLVLDSPELAARHQVLVDAGHEHSYPQFRPHISLKWGADSADLERAVGCMGQLFRQLPKVVLYREKWEKVDENHTPKPAKQPKSIPGVTKPKARDNMRKDKLKEAAGILSVAAEAEEAADGWERVCGRNSKGVHQTCYVKGGMMVHKTDRYHFGNKERWRAGKMKEGSNPLDIELDGETSTHPTLGEAKAACIPRVDQRTLPSPSKRSGMLSVAGRTSLTALERRALKAGGAYYRSAQWREPGYNSHIVNYRVNRIFKDTAGKTRRKSVVGRLSTKESADRYADMYNKKTAETGRWAI